MVKDSLSAPNIIPGSFDNNSVELVVLFKVEFATSTIRFPFSILNVSFLPFTITSLIWIVSLKVN